MATYIIVPDGGADVDGCAEAYHVKTFDYEFGENDYAFVKRKAEGGYLEEVVIEEVQVGQDQYGHDFITYKDTWHSIWNENELVAEQDAIDVAIDYWETQIVRLEAVPLCEGDNEDLLFSDVLERIEAMIERLQNITDIKIPLGGYYQRTVSVGR